MFQTPGHATHGFTTRATHLLPATLRKKTPGVTPTEPGATETLSDMDEEEDSQERPPIMPSPKEEMKMEQEKEEEDKDKKIVKSK